MRELKQQRRPRQRERQGRIQKIQKEGAEETDDAVLHHSGSICDQTLGLTLRTFQKYRKTGGGGGGRGPLAPLPPKSAHERHKTVGVISKNNTYARALSVFVHFFAVLCKTTT